MEYLAYPDYKWSAKDAWKCLGMMVVLWFLQLVTTFGVGLHSSLFREWFFTGVGQFCVGIVLYGLAGVNAAYFARTESLSSFFAGFGLDRKPSRRVCFGVVAMVAVKITGHIAAQFAYGKAIKFSVHAVLPRTVTFGIQAYFWWATVLILAPLVEEIVCRGFLYKAFRGSYSMGISIALLILCTWISHFQEYYQSVFLSIELSVFTVILCLTREKSPSIWDCVICHAVFNLWAYFVI